MFQPAIHTLRKNKLTERLVMLLDMNFDGSKANASEFLQSHQRGTTVKPFHPRKLQCQT